MSADVVAIARALDFAARKHAGQRRGRSRTVAVIASNP
jgi:hypothetical protein